MIRNVSYNDKKIRHEITGQIGRSYSIIERFRMRGIGSPRFIIRDASPSIMDLLNKDNNINYCNIELRRGGIIIGFRSILETYAWIVPFFALNLFKSLNVISIYSGQEFVRLTAVPKANGQQDFMRKLIRLKAEANRDQNPFQY